MINSSFNKYKRLKLDTEGELQPSASTSAQNLSEYQGIKKQLNIIQSTINSQTINIECNSATFTTDVAILDSIKILFPVANDVFTGRFDEFDKLNDYLMTKHLVVVCGMAGIGKTECSKKFAWNNSSKYEMKLWINADSEENIQKSVHEIASKLSIIVRGRDIVNIINDIYDYFENRNIFSLFVFDNANDRRSINNLLPSKACHDNTFINIIITSQNSKWGKRNGKDIPTVELFPLEIEFAVKVFREIIEDEFDNYDIALWEKLAKQLNGIPLALQITAAYIKNEILSIEEFGMDEVFSLQEYIKKLEDELHLIIDEPFPDDSENAYPRTIYIAVVITLDKIKLKEQFWQSAFDILYAISYLDPNYIVHDVLLRITPEDMIRKSLVILTKFSLVNTSNYKHQRKISVHRLVQWILRYYQKKLGFEIQSNHYRNVIMSVLNNESWSYFHQHLVLKHEMYFKEIISDYVADRLYVIDILIENNSFNSVSLIFERFDESNDVEELWFRTAISKSYTNCLRSLLQYLARLKVDFNEYKTSDGKLLYAAMAWIKNDNENSIECIRILVEKCTNVNLVDSSVGRFTPVLVAASRGFAKIVKLFIEEYKVDINWTERNGWSLIHYVIGSTYFNESNIELSPDDLGDFLVKSGADINIIDKQGRSLIHMACRYPSPIYLQYLINVHKLNVNLLDKEENHSLLLCFELLFQRTLFNLGSLYLRKEQKIIDCIDILFKNGANIYVKNKKGKTLIHLACQYYPLVVEYLVKTHKFDVNSKDNAEQTPLYDIIGPNTSNQNRLTCISQIAKFLLENGALVDITDINGLSPLTWALKKGRNELADILSTYANCNS